MSAVSLPPGCPVRVLEFYRQKTDVEGDSADVLLRVGSSPASAEPGLEFYQGSTVVFYV